jgi:DNA-binding response OmpR family regulator
VSLVLVVDDDDTVREVVVGYLERAGFETVEAADGLTAVRVGRLRRPDLVVLDLMLPGLDGLEVCRRLRVDRADLPVVMLTALGEEDDRVFGLELGADDYVTKPFSPRELVLRIQSVLRRSRAGDVSAPQNDSWLQDGELRVDLRGHRALLGNVEIGLTGREFDLLAHLMAHPGRAFSRDELMREVWGWEYGDQSTVTVHIRRLREKIESDPATPCRVVTVWGVGYRWDQQADATAAARGT